MINSHRLQRGFTLIELLVVIAIIGILATLILTNIQGVRERARDLRRKSDLSSIQKSLRLYFNDARTFPASDNGHRLVGCGTLAAPTACTWGSSFATATTKYMQRLPLDPSSGSSGNITYQYYRDPVDTDIYILVAALENASDQDITDSQARCSTIYASFDGTKSTKDYVVCSE